MTTSPLAYFWGDDDYMISRGIDDLVDALSRDGGGPLERLDPWADARPPAAMVGQIAERLTTATMFGGGTFIVLRNPGPLVKRNEDRDVLLAAIANVAPGNGLAVIDAHGKGAPRSKRRSVPHKRLADAIAAAGGTVQQMEPPTKGAFVAFVEREARRRGLKLDPGAALALAELVGGSAGDDDIERRYQTRRASMELDKLALYRPGTPITADDVRALVAAEAPASIFALTEAIAVRRTDQALAALDLVLETTPEPVILVLLHRRVRDLLEMKDRLDRGEQRAAIVAATGLHPFAAERLEAQARNWSTDELAAALHGLVDLDAMVKHAPGWHGDDAQRRLAFTLWVLEHVPRRARRSA